MRLSVQVVGPMLLYSCNCELVQLMRQLHLPADQPRAHEENEGTGVRVFAVGAFCLLCSAVEVSANQQVSERPVRFGKY